VHPEIDRYAHLDSPLHRWDPRWKLASLALLMASLAAAPAPSGRAPSLDRELPHALLSLAVSLALLQLSRIPLGFALRRLLPAGLFLGTFLLVYPLTIPGEGLRAGPVAISWAGLLSATVITIRALALILLAFPLLGTSRFDDTMKALAALRVPGPFVQLTVFAYRYIYVYSDELRRMRTAMRARGFQSRLSLPTLRAAGNGVGMLLVRSVERTQRIQAAMVARGYTGGFRTFHDFATRPADAMKAAAATAVAAGLLLFRYAP
jgi:cobalt/nickel transport system permease protein